METFQSDNTKKENHSFFCKILEGKNSNRKENCRKNGV